MSFKNGLSPLDNAQLYGWSQTIKSLTITIELPSPIDSPKHLEVIIKPDSLSVRLKTAPQGEYIINGSFWKPIKCENSTWQIEDRQLITIELEKLNKSEWWNTVIVGHKEVDPSKLQPDVSRDVSDLDGETQKLVKKMMFDNRQKEMGLPTSDELQKEDMLKKFAAQHPEFDFSKANIQM